MPIDRIFFGSIWVLCMCTAMHRQDQYCSIQVPDAAIIKLLCQRFETSYVNEIINEHKEFSLAALLTSRVNLTNHQSLLDDLCYQVAFSSVSKLTTRLEEINDCIVHKRLHVGRTYDNLPAILTRLDEIKLLVNTIKTNHRKLAMLTQQVPLNLTNIGKRLVEEVGHAEIVFASFIANCFNTPARIQFFAEHDNGCQEQWHKLYKRLKIYLPTD